MSMSPSPSLVANLHKELVHWPPFAQMAPVHVDRFVQAATQVYHEPGETLLSPTDGPVKHLWLIRRGSVSGRHGMADTNGGFQYGPGDMFPIGAATGERAVTSTYTAVGDVFCLQLPVAVMHALAGDSAPFADFVNHWVQHFLALSRQALQAAYVSQTLAEQSLESPLRDLVRRAPVGVPDWTPLGEALKVMHDKRIGSVLILAEHTGAALGILTRHDILGRVTLAERPLSTPIHEVMSAPVVSVGIDQTAQDAALAMSRHGIRHVPVTDASGRAVGILSERDLFALQRLSLKQVSTAIRAAPDLAALLAVAQDIRRFAGNLLGQGVGARQLTGLISHLNDALTERLVTLVAHSRSVDLSCACWLAFGSEGRGEQTIATDQDNGIVFTSDHPDVDRRAWLAFAREVNESLAACGYPLCKGNIMASNPECCLTPGEWQARFMDWIDHGAPEDLLKASIYFDFRALAGACALPQAMRELVTHHTARTPRFLKQMAENALRNGPALNWRGGIDAESRDGHDVVDLKLHGTAIFVDAARLYALAHGMAAINTRERFEAVMRVRGVPAREVDGWIGGFEYLQLLRLRGQLARDRLPAVEPGDAYPNLVDVATLNDIDHRVLRESLRIARRLQQRIEMDYLR